MEPKVGGPSPWGAIDAVENIAEGVVFVSTPSHGGVWLSGERLAGMPLYLLAPSQFYQAGSHWFEEDCEVMRVVVAFPELFKTPKEDALKSLLAMNEAVRTAAQGVA